MIWNNTWGTINTWQTLEHLEPQLSPTLKPRQNADRDFFTPAHAPDRDLQAFLGLYPGV